MKLKALYIILLFTCLTIQVQAQNEWLPTTTQAQKSPEIIPEHEVSIGYGEPFSLPLFIEQGTTWGGLIPIGRFHASYIYRLKKWLGIGAIFTYSPYTISYDRTIYNVNGTNINTEQKNSMLHGTVFSFAAEVRFYMLSKSWVNLYGGLALGYSAEFSLNNIANEIPAYYRNDLYWQVTLLGVSFGKNIIFGTEFGFGSKGILNAYIGYKF